MTDLDGFGSFYIQNNYLTKNSFSQTWPGKQNLHDTLDTVIRDTYSSPILMFFEMIKTYQNFKASLRLGEWLDVVVEAIGFSIFQKWFK